MRNLIPTGNIMEWQVSRLYVDAETQQDLEGYDLIVNKFFIAGSFVYLRAGLWRACSRKQRAEFTTKEAAMFWAEAVYAMDA